MANGSNNNGQKSSVKKYFSISFKDIDLKRIIFISVGILLFTIVYFSPIPADAVDPMGKNFALTNEGKAALALFLLAACWWVFEVVPIGITSITIGVIQVLFLIRPAKVCINS